MNEKCKCGNLMTLSREYQRDGFSFYEFGCQEYLCDIKHVYQICNNCKHEISWWKE